MTGAGKNAGPVLVVGGGIGGIGASLQVGWKVENCLNA